jgi:hypothetical protein
MPARPRLIARYRQAGGGAAVLLLTLLFPSAPSALAAQDGTGARVGVFVERNYSTQPGLEAAYQFTRLLGGRSRLTASYSSTRLETALGSHALAEDRLQARASLHFRRARTISPHTGIALGYTRFDRENEEVFGMLDNDAFIASVVAGTEIRLHRELRASGSIGYSLLQSSTVYPLVLTAGANHPFPNHSRR